MLKETSRGRASQLSPAKTFDQMSKPILLDPWKKYSGGLISEDDISNLLQFADTKKNGTKFSKHN